MPWTTYLIRLPSGRHNYLLMLKLNISLFQNQFLFCNLNLLFSIFGQNLISFRYKLIRKRYTIELLIQLICSYRFCIPVWVIILLTRILAIHIIAIFSVFLAPRFETVVAFGQCIQILYFEINSIGDFVCNGHFVRVCKIIWEFWIVLIII